jgi:hypothetical protein
LLVFWKKLPPGFTSRISDFDTTHNNTLFVPPSTMERLGGSSMIYFLQAEVLDEEMLDEASQKIRSVLNYQSLVNTMVKWKNTLYRKWRLFLSP